MLVRKWFIDSPEGIVRRRKAEYQIVSLHLPPRIPSRSIFVNVIFTGKLKDKFSHKCGYTFYIECMYM